MRLASSGSWKVQIATVHTKTRFERVRGTADANSFKSARIEIGQSEEPSRWTDVSAAAKSSAPNGILGEIPASAFAGSTLWYIRVVVTHTNGLVREARFKLNLG